MDEATLDRYRADVIKRSIKIEWFLNFLISLHYLKRVDEEFILKILYDPSFSFRLKVSAVQKINGIDSGIIGRLHEMADIRNYFAHFDINFVVPTGEKVSFDPKHLEQTINFQEKYDRFIELEKIVNPYLFKVCKELGLPIISSPQKPQPPKEPIKT
jgi:hypothetical protein